MYIYKVSFCRSYFKNSSNMHAYLCCDDDDEDCSIFLKSIMCVCEREYV